MVFQQVGNGCVQVAATLFTLCHTAVEPHGAAATEAPDKGQKLFLGAAQRREQHVGHDDSTGVDERIAGNAVFIFQLYQRIERITGRLLTHALPQAVSLLAEAHG